MTLRFSPATQSDIPPILAQAKNLIDTYEDCAAINYEKVLQWVEKKITANISTYTAVVRDDRIVAYYRLCRDGELDDLYVLPGYRNQGIGSEILKKCITDSEAPLWLYVFTGNTRAISFYGRFGFTCREAVGKTRLILARKG